MNALLKWCVFCVVTGRRPRLDLDTRHYFEIGDREDLSYEEKLAAYRELADEYFEVDRYQDFCDSRLGHVDELVLDWVASPDFDRLLVDTVRATYPAHEHERFVGPLPRAWSASGCASDRQRLSRRLHRVHRPVPVARHRRRLSAVDPRPQEAPQVARRTPSTPAR